MKLLISIFLLTTSITAHGDATAQADQILKFFGANCSANGEWTRGAIGYAKNLVEIMRNLRDDKNCSTIAGAISDLTNLQAEVEKLQNNTTQKELMALAKEEQQLLLALSSSTDVSEKAIISTELRRVQLAQARQAGYEDANNNPNAQIKSQQAMETLVINTQAFLSTVNSNQECLQSNTGLLSGIASMTASVVSSVVPAYIGLPIKAGVELTGQIVEFSRRNRINKHIKRTNQSIASVAYHCTLETLSNHWCSAQDTLNAINLKEMTLTNPNDDMFLGVRILDRELPSLLRWLSKVRAGSIPTTTAEAERQNRSIRRETRVRLVSRFGQGVINERRDLYNTSIDDKTRWQILRRVIQAIVMEVRNDPDQSALEDIYPFLYAPYYLLGLTTSEAPRANGNFLPFDAFDPFDPNIWPSGKPPYVPDLNLLEKNFTAWVDEATDNVQREIIQVLQVSPLEVMDDAINNEGKLLTTPRLAIKTILKFLGTNMPKEFATENHRRIYLDTIDLLTKIAKNIDDVHDEQVLKSPLLALTDINNLAQLRFGTVLIDGRVTRAVRYALNDIVIKRSNISNDLASQLLAADDIVKALQRLTPSLNFTTYRVDISESQSMVQNTMQQFVNLFAKSIKKSLENYEALAVKAKEGPRGPNRQAKAGLCIKLLSLAEWPDKIPLDLCTDAQLFHINPKGPKSVKFTKEELDKPLSERICHYRNFLRSSYIFQNYQQNPSEKSRRN